MMWEGDVEAERSFCRLGTIMTVTEKKEFTTAPGQSNHLEGAVSPEEARGATWSHYPCNAFHYGDTLQWCNKFTLQSPQLCYF